MDNDERRRSGSGGREPAGETQAASGPQASGEPPLLEEKDFPKLLGKFYRVTRKIGEGGMGVVFEVEHTKMGKKFAAKVISRYYASDREAVRRLELEAIAASKIESPHIVQVTHLDTEGDFTYIIMELLKGRSLAALIAGRPLPMPLAVEIARQTSKGLIAAHEAGIVHRDLKPENIFLINQEGNLYVKLLDFGISKIRYGPDANVKLTKTGQIIGTPLYFSPEQARGLAEIDGRTDIYALGVIFFEMVTGEPVFDAKSPIDLIVKHATQPPPSPREKNPQVPEDIERIVLKCLAKDPGGRYQSARDLLDDLERIDAGQVPGEVVLKATTTTDPLLQVTDSTRMELSVRKGWVGGSRILVAAGVIILAAAVVSGVAFLRKRSEAPPSAAAKEQLAQEKEAGAPPKGAAAGGEEEAKEKAEVALVTFTITSSPDKAEVWAGSERAGQTPFIYKAPKDGREYAFEIRAKGYRDEKVIVTADDDFARHVKLKEMKKAVKVDIKTEQ